jgi:hypothetical protein
MWSPRPRLHSSRGAWPPLPPPPLPQQPPPQQPPPLPQQPQPDRPPVAIQSERQVRRRHPVRPHVTRRAHSGSQRGATHQRGRRGRRQIKPRRPRTLDGAAFAQTRLRAAEAQPPPVRPPSDRPFPLAQPQPPPNPRRPPHQPTRLPPPPFLPPPFPPPPLCPPSRQPRQRGRRPRERQSVRPGAASPRELAPHPTPPPTPPHPTPTPNPPPHPGRRLCGSPPPHPPFLRCSSRRQCPPGRPRLPQRPRRWLHPRPHGRPPTTSRAKATECTRRGTTRRPSRSTSVRSALWVHTRCGGLRRRARRRFGPVPPATTPTALLR